MNAPSPRILLVDDDREILEMTALLLRGAGYAVTIAASGEEALVTVHEQPFDAVLLDINMPGMDGWEVLRLLREDDLTARLPVIVFSVNFEVRDKLHALQRGAQDYVTKPFDTAVLLQKVGDVCRAPAGGASA